VTIRSVWHQWAVENALQLYDEFFARTQDTSRKVSLDSVRAKLEQTQKDEAQDIANKIIGENKPLQSGTFPWFTHSLVTIQTVEKVCVHRKRYDGWMEDCIGGDRFNAPVHNKVLSRTLQLTALSESDPDLYRIDITSTKYREQFQRLKVQTARFF
jgi:hypothetical protein